MWGWEKNNLDEIKEGRLYYDARSTSHQDLFSYIAGVNIFY